MRVDELTTASTYLLIPSTNSDFLSSFAGICKKPICFGGCYDESFGTCTSGSSSGIGSECSRGRVAQFFNADVADLCHDFYFLLSHDPSSGQKSKNQKRTNHNAL